jgi:hypothetical protein
VEDIVNLFWAELWCRPEKNELRNKVSLNWPTHKTGGSYIAWEVAGGLWISPVRAK